MIDIIYIRTSTEDQNPKNQLKEIQIISPVGAVVYEEKQSAWKDHIKMRPVFSELIKLIKKGKVKSFNVWDLDRIYRKRLLTVEFMQLCRAFKVIVRSYRQDWLQELDRIPEPWNEIMRDQLIQIFAWMAEEESNKKSERVKSAIRQKNGRTVSYKGNLWGRKPLPKQTISKVLELHEKGLSIRAIAKEVKTTDKNNNMKLISKSVVHKILQEFSKKNPSNSDMSHIDSIKGQGNNKR